MTQAEIELEAARMEDRLEFHATELREITTATECGNTRVERQRGPSFLDPELEVEAIILFRCVREPDHSGEHVGEEVEPQRHWEAWDR